ncbi:MAG: DUF4178 domain-containing protein [Polyangiaceae bacterium]
MAVAQGQCPGCGAPIEFGLGSSIAKVCPYCQATVLRTDRGLQNLGKVADMANTPCLIAVGDQGTLATRPFEVLGRVQLDHGKGPWDEFYVSFDYGQSWGWLAFAQGHWYVTQQVAGLAVPPISTLQLEQDIQLGNQFFRVAEVKEGTIVSAEGELPEAFPPGFVRHYVDLYGQQNAFATIDYGDNSGPYTVFIGYVFPESQMQAQQLGERHTKEVKTDTMQCPNCGGEVPKLMQGRAERMACPYCYTISDIASRQIVAQQEAAMQQPDIPIGQQGTFDGVQYMCIAYLRRGCYYDDEHFSWEEYLLWSQGIGFRWLVKDPENGWSWITPVNIAEIDISQMPNMVSWGGRVFQNRDWGSASVEYVLGEVYWKCEIGESTRADDFVDGGDVLSREMADGEVQWSFAQPIAWPVLAQGFNLPVDGPGAYFPGGGGGANYAGASGGGSGGGCGQTMVLLIVVGVILFICMIGACGACGGGGGGGGYSSGSTTSGGGVFVGGK